MQQIIVVCQKTCSMRMHDAWELGACRLQRNSARGEFLMYFKLIWNSEDPEPRCGIQLELICIQLTYWSQSRTTLWRRICSLSSCPFTDAIKVHDGARQVGIVWDMNSADKLLEQLNFTVHMYQLHDVLSRKFFGISPTSLQRLSLIYICSTKCWLSGMSRITELMIIADIVYPHVWLSASFEVYLRMRFQRHVHYWLFLLRWFFDLELLHVTCLLVAGHLSQVLKTVKL